MITISELTKISDDKVVRDKQEEESRKQKFHEKFEKEYLDATLNLEERLRKAAAAGAKKLTVCTFTAYGHGEFKNLTDEFKEKMKQSGNLQSNWRKTIFPEDVKSCMIGNLKRVYDYVSGLNLNPVIEYWTDGGGQDEGFEVMIMWP